MVARHARVLLAVFVLITAAPVAWGQPVPRDFRRWIAEEAEWLLTPAERRAAEALREPGAQAQFVREFWQRRDPTPGTPENELYQEHARRLPEADAKFTSGRRGRFTDRGRIYISWGPPDFVESNPSGGRGFALGPLSQAPELPTEVWTYEHLTGLAGRTGRVQVVFVDRGGGDYRVLTDPADANQAYAYRLNTTANPLQYESAAFLDPTTGLKRTDRAAETARAGVLGPDASLSSSANTFERIALGADLSRTAGEVLEEIERSQRLRRPVAEVRARVFARRFEVGVDVPIFRTPDGEAYCPLSVNIPGDAFAGAARPRGELDVRVIVREARTGTPVRTFADLVRFDLGAEAWARARRSGFTYQKAMALSPGEYALEIAIAHEAASAFGSASIRVTVPPPPGGLALTGLLLGQAAPSSGVVGPFTIGDIDLHPRVTRQFTAGEPMHALVQLAGLRGDAESELTVDYVILRERDVVFQSPLFRLPAAPGAKERLIVVPIEPGALPAAAYLLQLKVIDHAAQSYAVSRVPFSIAQQAATVER